jgi:hypothetical protein
MFTEVAELDGGPYDDPNCSSNHPCRVRAIVAAA